MPPAATVEGRWQIGKLLGNSIGRYVEAISRDGSVAWTVIRPRSGRTTKEIDAVAYECGDVVRSADYANGEIGNVVIGTAAIRKAGWIGRRHSRGVVSEDRQPFLLLRECWSDPKIESQQLSARFAAVVAVKRLPRILEK